MGLNFLEALIELKEGRCDEIQHKSKDYFVVRSYEAFTIIPSLDILKSTDWELVNTKPQFKEVEVVVYIHKTTGKLTQNLPFGEHDSFEENWIKLTGRIKSEVKPKIKHREEIELYGSPIPNALPKDCKFFAEWSE